MQLDSIVRGAVAGAQGAPAMVPPGFVPVPDEPFVAHVGPLYERPDGDGGWVIGCRPGAHHGNMFGVVHGGMLATICDYVLGHNAHMRCKPGQQIATVSLNLDYVGAGRVGEWIQGEATMDKEQGRLKFCNCSLRGEDGRVLIRASGVFSSYTPKQA